MPLADAAIALDLAWLSPLARWQNDLTTLDGEVLRTAGAVVLRLDG